MYVILFLQIITCGKVDESCCEVIVICGKIDESYFEVILIG